jgi:hypothetical protein
MTPQQTGLLVLQLLVSLVILGYIASLMLEARKERLKFRVFAVRDQFLYQAATGVLSQDTQVFKVFYSAMNTYISQMEKFTLMSFGRASVAVKTELAKENQKRLVEALSRADPEVQKTVNNFIGVVIEAMKFNTPVLTFLIAFAIHCSKLYKWISELRVTIKLYGATEFYDVYDAYWFYDNLQGKIATVETTDRHLAIV